MTDIELPSPEPQTVCEPQMVQEFQRALKEKMTNPKNKMNRWSSEGISRRSQRDRKAPERLQVKSMKGKSYDFY